MNIRITRDYYDFRIFIDEVPHVWIDAQKLCGFQAWSDTNHSYSIEFTIDGCQPLRVEYTTEAKWLAVLKQLEQVL